MAREKEDWSDLDATMADGIEPATAMLLRRLITEMYGEHQRREAVVEDDRGAGALFVGEGGAGDVDDHGGPGHAAADFGELRGRDDGV